MKWVAEAVFVDGWCPGWWVAEVKTRREASPSRIVVEPRASLNCPHQHATGAEALDCALKEADKRNARAAGRIA